MKRISLNIDSLALLVMCLDIDIFPVQPLDNDEWYEVERVLKVHGMKGPHRLFDMTINDYLDILEFDETMASKMGQRLKYLNHLMIYLGKIETMHLSLTTKYEDDFPKDLGKSMKKRAPLYLFYTGDLHIIDHQISLVGLLHEDYKEHAYAQRLVDKMRDENYVLISQDSTGIDYEVLQYALHHGVKAILFICAKYQETYKKYKRYIQSGQLLILCVSDPKGYFTVTKAIDRNSYVCGLSKYQIVISSKINSGAIWFTALQNMHHHWTKLLVLSNECSGNLRLLEMNATPLKVKDILSDLMFDMIYENNHLEEVKEEVDIDQMTIFEFLGDSDEF